MRLAKIINSDCLESAYCQQLNLEISTQKAASAWYLKMILTTQSGETQRDNYHIERMRLINVTIDN